LGPKVIRIIAGVNKGFRLKVPPGPTRPTALKVREAIFSIIGEKVLDARVLDPYAGSGAMALEALSRGAAAAVMADSSNEAIKALNDNVSLLKAKDGAIVLKARQPTDFNRLFVASPYDLIFLDPPYAEIEPAKFFLQKAAKESLAAPLALAVWEMDPKTKEALEPKDVAPWVFLSYRAWGRRAAYFLELPLSVGKSY
jgi:16S rRNA (guanine(966)-N(2))-methyltransferase RsmD